METQHGNEPTGGSRVGGATWLGLFVSLLGILIIRSAAGWIAPHPGPTAVLLRELVTLGTAAGLLLLVRYWEKRPLTSIGIGTSALWKSLLWGLGLSVLCAAAALILAKLTDYGGGERAAAFERLPLGVMTLVVFRAGIVEELFYRGYAMERLRDAGLKPAAAFLLPLLIFALAHYPGGWANILIALVLGGILAGFYAWRRDLTANIIAHTLVDFVANVLPRLVR